MHRAKNLVIACFFGVVCACSIHTVDVQQGNIITPEMISQLKLGMNKKQIQFLMGTPLINDPFHKNRWDYLFMLDEGESVKKEMMTLYFENDRLVRIIGPSDNESMQAPDTEDPTTSDD